MKRSRSQGFYSLTQFQWHSGPLLDNLSNWEEGVHTLTLLSPPPAMCSAKAGCVQDVQVKELQLSILDCNAAAPQGCMHAPME